MQLDDANTVNADQTETKTTKSGLQTGDLTQDDVQDARKSRYADPNVIEDISRSKNINELRPFYDGDLVNKRMTSIRESIMHIRKHWQDRGKFLSKMEEFFQENELYKKDDVLKQRIHNLGQRQWEWGDLDPQVMQEDFTAIRVYTSEQGYNYIFSLINTIFRQDDSVQQDAKIINAVFLVELINIDLFNFCLKFPKYNNFQGVVYRGLGLKAPDFAAFETLLTRPISGRYIAVPLGLWSSTSDVTVALDFIKKNQKDTSSNKIPVMLRIHVIELKPEYLEYYRQTYPSSVVSTICAVDIHELSDFAEESEVILRGAFCQILNLHQSELEAGTSCNILDAVMVNTNRDHLSTAQLNEHDAPARELFRHMVGATRSAFAARYCEEYSLHKDAEEYRAAVKAAEESLKELMI